MSDAAETVQDERIKDASFIQKLMRRPELGALAGLVIVTVFFLFTADSSMFTLAGVMNFMSPAAQLGILAVGAALLMIGGEFDLSLGSMIAFTGLFFGAAVVTWGLPLPVAIIITLFFAAGAGAINGQIVIRTGLPSFIVTLAFLALQAKFGLMPGGTVPSGPNLITGEKAAQVVDLSARGIR